MKQWLKDAIEKNKSWWARNYWWIVLICAVLLALSLFSCVGGPPKDIYTEEPFGTIVAQVPDGKLDSAYINYLNGNATMLNAATGGVFAPWIGVITTALTVVGGFVVHQKGKKDHESNKEQIACNIQELTALKLENAQLKARLVALEAKV